MNGGRLAILFFLLAASVLNFLGHTGRHDAICFDLATLRVGWCYPHEPHLVPVADNVTFMREAVLLALAGVAWFRVTTDPA